MQCITFALTATWIVEGLISGSWDINGRSLIVPLLALVMFAFLQTVPFGAGHPETGMSAEWRTISVDPYGTRLAAFKLLTLNSLWHSAAAVHLEPAPLARLDLRRDWSWSRERSVRHSTADDAARWYHFRFASPAAGSGVRSVHQP